MNESTTWQFACWRRLPRSLIGASPVALYTALFVVLLVVAALGTACSSATDDSIADSVNDSVTDSANQIVNDARDQLDPETVAPEIDPPAYQPTWIPDGFSISRASAASADFMSIEVAAENATASVIWGDELVDFEVLAQSDPAGSSQTVRGNKGTLFTFASTEESVGPALIWREPSGLPVLVVGSAEVTSDDVVAIADGIEEITQQEFLDLAIRLAEERLASSGLDSSD